MLMSLSSWPTRRRPNTTGSRTAPQPFLNDSQWKLLADLFPVPQRTSLGGRPPFPPRPCLEGILWILRTGARRQDLPERYPSPSTCWRRLKRWSESGLFREAWTRLCAYHNWHSKLAVISRYTHMLAVNGIRNLQV